MFMQNGFDGFIPKPIDSRKLDAVLNDFIRDKKPPEIVEAARKERLNKENKRKLSDLEKFFLIDAVYAVNKLDEVYAKINDPEEKDIETYKITVHGIKSALANIGETELCETARVLEQAATEKNLEQMAQETPAFINALKSLIEKLDAVKDLNDAQMTGEDEAYLREKLLVIEAACKTMDKKAVAAVMDDLKQKDWPRRINDKIDELSVHLLHSDFEKVEAAATETIAALSLEENTVKDGAGG